MSADVAEKMSEYSWRSTALFFSVVAAASWVLVLVLHLIATRRSVYMRRLGEKDERELFVSILIMLLFCLIQVVLVLLTPS